MATSSKHFSDDELKCPCCSKNNMDEGFLKVLEQLRVEYGKPMKVTSAYRCPKHNAQVSETGWTGPHTTGKAIDIYVKNPDARTILGLACKYGFTGLGVSQKGDSHFLHLDMVDRKALWSY